jgi:hypothetical protein
MCVLIFQESVVVVAAGMIAMIEGTKVEAEIATIVIVVVAVVDVRLV